jgi:hypothetical protein
MKIKNKVCDQNKTRKKAKQNLKFTDLQNTTHKSNDCATRNENLSLKQTVGKTIEMYTFYLGKFEDTKW